MATRRHTHGSFQRGRDQAVRRGDEADARRHHQGQEAQHQRGADVPPVRRDDAEREEPVLVRGQDDGVGHGDERPQVDGRQPARYVLRVGKGVHVQHPQHGQGACRD